MEKLFHRPEPRMIPLLNREVVEAYAGEIYTASAQLPDRLTDPDGEARRHYGNFVDLLNRGGPWLAEGFAQTQPKLFSLLCDSELWLVEKQSFDPLRNMTRSSVHTLLRVERGFLHVRPCDADEADPVSGLALDKPRHGMIPKVIGDGYYRRSAGIGVVWDLPASVGASALLPAPIDDWSFPEEALKRAGLKSNDARSALARICQFASEDSASSFRTVIEARVPDQPKRTGVVVVAKKGVEQHGALFAIDCSDASRVVRVGDPGTALDDYASAIVGRGELHLEGLLTGEVL